MRALSVEGCKIVPRVTGWLFHICSKKLDKVPSVWRAVNMLMVPVRPSPATITWIPSVRRRSAKPTAQRHAMAIKTSGAWPRMPLVTSALHQNHHIGQSTWSIYMVNLHGPFSMLIYEVQDVRRCANGIRILPPCQLEKCHRDRTVTLISMTSWLRPF